MTVDFGRMSHSRYDLYAGCGERFRLEKIEKVPRTPSIYAVAGTAFHDWTEDWDLDRGAQRIIGIEDWYQRLWALVQKEEEQSGYSLDQWDTPAFGKDANRKAYEKFRDELGPDMLQKYIAWREETGWELAELPPDNPPVDRDGNPKREPITIGVEYRAEYTLGSVQDTNIIDRVFVTPDGLVALDLKTWSKQRNTAQLPSYVVALRQRGVNVHGAGYYEARKGEVTDLKSYRFWDETRLAALHEQAAAMMAAGFFLPRVSNDCGICDVRRHCQFAPE